MGRVTRSTAKMSQTHHNENFEQDPMEDPMEETNTSKPAASFTGRLELASFTFQNTNANITTTSQPSATITNTPPTKPATINSSTSTKTNSRSSSPRKRTRPTPKQSPHFPPLPPSKRSRPSSPAKPTTNKSLPLLPDALGPSIILLFVGLNPGIQTSLSGHAYAHPSNHFWKLLFSSGILPVPCKPEEDSTLPSRFSLGLTNIVSRPSRSGADLSKAELDAGVALLHEKAWRTRAEAVCIVGKGIWESVFRVKYGRGMRKGDGFEYGWQREGERMGVGLEGRGLVPLGEEDGGKGGGEGRERQKPYQGARVFVATSTSGLAATVPMKEKERIWRVLGEWVEGRREERERDNEGKAAVEQAEVRTESNGA